jgi:hypothetical protein
MRVARYAFGLVGALLVAAVVWGPLRAKAQRQGVTNQPTQFQVDPFWPKPLPRDAVSGKPWVTGEVGGTCVDSQDHIFTVNRASQNGLIAPEDVIAQASPPYIEYDTEGNVVNAFGDPTVVPNGLHGCFIDSQDNFWTAGNGDGVVQKYAHNGQFILQIGVRGRCDSPDHTCGNPGSNMSQRLLNQPANMAVDPTNGDVYIADGYGNHRIVVFDSKGTFLRQWGNAGTLPGQFQPNDGGHPHCVRISAEGLVYACDRGSDRIQVFEKNPSSCTGVPPDRVCQPLRMIPVIPGTADLPTAGSAWDLDFSRDSSQSLFYEADGGNEILHIFDRMAGSIIGGFGGPGHQAGNFTFLHSVTIDSQGNLFTGETIGGRRIQKFVPVRGAKGKNATVN